MKMKVEHESFPIAGTFTISRGSKTTVEVVTVTLEDGGAIGRGECVPYARYGESIESVINQLHAISGQLNDGMIAADIQTMLPAGAARNALDCAMWDLVAKRSGDPVYKLLGMEQMQSLTTAYTLSLDTPENMGKKALENAHRPLMKLKLTGDGDLERVASVRENAPESRLIVDANEGWSVDQVEPFSESLLRYGVELIEQPLPAGQDALLAEVSHPITICADESVHTCATLKDLVGRYDAINIKIDKTGGISEAMELRRMAEAEGLQIMVGCMLATSLAMAPAMLVAQGAAYVDLDGPLLLAEDRDPGLSFQGSIIAPPEPKLWG